MIKWFEDTYKVDYDDPEGPIRHLEISEHAADIRRNGGYAGETEIDGNRALVRVRASRNELSGLSKNFKVVDPEQEWTPTRAVPYLHKNEIAISDTLRHKTKPLEDVIAHVADDKEWYRAQKAADTLFRKADEQGHILVVGDSHHVRRVLLLAARAGYGLDKISPGTFPVTSLIDNFNRADENPVAGFTRNYGTSADLKVATNLLAMATATSSSMHLTAATTYGPDAEAGIDVPTKPANDTEWCQCFLRLTNPTTSSICGYRGRWIFKAGGSNDSWKIYRIDNGTYTELGTGPVTGPDLGSKVGFEVISTGLAIYLYTTSWALAESQTDATYGTAGKIGVGTNGQAARLDNFFGGTISTSTNYTADMSGHPAAATASASPNTPSVVVFI